MFVLGNATFACGVHSTHKRSFEEASGETEVGRGLLEPEPRPLPPLVPQTPPACKPNNLNQRPLPGGYIAWNWTIPVVMLATVVATAATLSSNSCKSANLLDAFYFRSTETVRCERYIS